MSGDFDTSDDGDDSGRGKLPRAGRLIAEGGYADVFEASVRAPSSQELHPRRAVS
jgi:hypothetical protein